MPTCTVDRVQQEQGLRFDGDFNGDGEMATRDDMFRELKGPPRSALTRRP